MYFVTYLSEVFMSLIVPVILAGGEGKRLHPLSCGMRPKQFLRLIKDSNDTLLQSAARRAMAVAEPQNIITVASDNYDSIIFQQLGELDNKLQKNIILETCARNTAPATIIAAIHAVNMSKEAVLWILPSDHLISGGNGLARAVNMAAKFASANNRIVTFGVKAERVESNYGYIVSDRGADAASPVLPVNMFLEKPEGERLAWIHRQNHFWWNSGMYVIPASLLLSEVAKHNLAMGELVFNAYEKGRISDFGTVTEDKHYSQIAAESIDRLVIEKNRNLAVIPVDIGWTDLGSWQSLWEISQREGQSSPLENFLQKIRHAA